MNALRRDDHIGGLVDAVDETAVREQRARARSATPTGIDWVLTDASRLTGSIKSLRSNYLSASPYPHLVLDNLFSEDLLDRVVHEMLPRAMQTGSVTMTITS